MLLTDSFNPGLNTAEPLIMHIDLNSCFATVEQQARPRLRNRPICVTNRLTPNCCIITASYEAKREGVKVGMRFREAVKLCPGLIMIETDPPKYHYVYKKLMGIMQSYTPHVQMRSIDEGMMDFSDTLETVHASTMEQIGYDIKKKLRDEVGCYMSCNVGIAPNRFLAKTAASLHKPDGLDIITHKNLRQVLGGLELTDLTGIAHRNEARLRSVGITTPLQFLDSDVGTLQKFVFQSVCGIDWYKRLRGWEVDALDWGVKSVGRQYVLEKRGVSEGELMQRLHYLTESTAMKLRYQNKSARGVFVYAKTIEGERWYNRRKFSTSTQTNKELYRRVIGLYRNAPPSVEIREIGLHTYDLEDCDHAQTGLFDGDTEKQGWLTTAIDSVNFRYGEFTVHSADTLQAKPIVKQKIPFGSTRYFELLCKRG
jgi:DNA polymerase-4